MKNIILISVFFLIHGVAFAAPSHIVLLKSSFSTKLPSRPLNRNMAYTHVRRTMDERLLKELRPFVNNNKALITSEVIYLPLISGLGLDLNPEQLRVIQSHPSVYKIMVNGKIQHDQPSGPVQVYPIRTSQIILNDALLLHEVDDLLATGIDISKAGKVVGIIDTGIDGTHPDLANKVIRFKDFLTGSAKPVDSDEHGTHVAGIIAGGNKSGVQLGVYPGAQLVVASALSKHSHMVQALQWMLDPDGNPQTADHPYVINNSWHIGSADAAPFYIALQALKDADILVCFSAGNAGSSGITRPKEYPTTFTTAAVDKGGLIASFSSWGPAKFQGQLLQKPEVASMGKDVMSTLPRGRYGKMSGTSMASPFTAGSVALLGAHFPNMSPYAIAQVLVETSERQVRAPWDKQYGNGTLNILNAFLALKQVH